MIILDTNVISELLRPQPAESVETWIASQPVSSLFTTTVTEAEILFGIALLPKGKRRDALKEAVRDIFETALEGRVLPFDRDAAEQYATIAACRRSKGIPISQFDAQIAAIAQSRGATLATRNTRDFTDCGVDVFDPWST